MAKALLGHIGGADPRMLAEVQRLQRRVRDLENELGRAKADNDALAAAMHADSFDRELRAAVEQREPALT